MKKVASKDIVVGFSVTGRAVQAAVIERGPEGTRVVKQFTRPRARLDMVPGGMDDAGGPQQFAEIDADDPTVRFDQAPADASSAFLTSEFGLGDVDDSVTLDMPGVADTAGAGDDFGMRPATIEIELADLFDEIREAGYGHAGTAFVINSADLLTKELTIPSDQKKVRKGQEREMLLAMLAHDKEARFDPDTVVFVQMTLSEGGDRRMLAVAPRPTDPVVPTLRRMSERKRPLPYVDVIDTEVTLLLGLARLAGNESGSGRRMLVRVGAEDTLVLYTQNDNLHFFETLRSVTTFDAPETVCSRIMLLQDEYGFQDADELLVLGEDEEDRLLERFESFFPDVKTRSLRALIPAPEDLFESDRTREAAMASAIGLRIAGDPSSRDRFEPVNLVPKKLNTRKRRVSVGFDWQMAAMLVILFASTLFFVGRYFSQRHEAEMLEFKLSQYSPDLVSGNARTLQARIDSMQYAAAGYLRALDVLDSMLVGSDQWSRAMERTARATAAIPGVWVETWEESGAELVLAGTATDRDKVVRFAARTEATIETLSFSKIRDWPVYSFRMRLPLPAEMPEAALYLRERVADLNLTEHSD